MPGILAGHVLATPTLKTTKVEPYSEDDEGSDPGSHSDTTNDALDDDPGVLEVKADPPVWSVQQLVILGPLKDKWYEGTAEEQKDLLKTAVEELTRLDPQDKKALTRKAKRWLKRKTGKRKQYGPASRPSLQTVVGYYMETEVTNKVYEDFGIRPGDKAKRFVGLYKTTLSKVLRDIRNNPMRKDDKKRMEEARTKWMEIGPPPARKRR